MSTTTLLSGDESISLVDEVSVFRQIGFQRSISLGIGYFQVPSAQMGFPAPSAVKNLPADAAGMGSVPA